MDLKQDLLKALFDANVRLTASKMFQSNFDFRGYKDRMPIDIQNLNIRLHKPTQNYVNLETLISSPIGDYFQTIGFYEEDNSIWILNEFVQSYKKLQSLGIIAEKAKFPDKKTNAIIAAFSITTLGFASEVLNDFKKKGWKSEFKDNMEVTPFMRYDRRFESNGFKCELIFSEEGYPYFYLDDEHGLEGAIGAYNLEEGDKIGFAPVVEYKELFDSLKRFKLLSAFNKLN